jgi:S1-C subfamily serine protease
MNKLIPLLVSIILFLGVSTAQYKNTVKTQIKPQGTIYMGTGTYVTPTIVLTARHVIIGFKQVYIIEHGTWYNAEVIAQDKNKDLALIHVFGPAHSYAQIGNASDKESAALKGYDLGRMDLKTHSVTFDFHQNQDNLNAIIPDDETCEGDSGGPVIDSNNKIIGIDLEGSIEPKDITRRGCSKLGFVAKSGDIQSFLESNGIYPENKQSDINAVYVENDT